MGERSKGRRDECESNRRLDRPGCLRSLTSRVNSFPRHAPAEPSVPFGKPGCTASRCESVDRQASPEAMVEDDAPRRAGAVDTVGPDGAGAMRVAADRTEETIVPVQHFCAGLGPREARSECGHIRARRDRQAKPPAGPGLSRTRLPEAPFVVPDRLWPWPVAGLKSSASRSNALIDFWALVDCRVKVGRCEGCERARELCSLDVDVRQ